MEVTATPAVPKGPGKRAPAKAKAPPSATPRKPAARVAKPAATILPSPAVLNGMIAEAAYHLAACRGFAPGREMDDWLQAEQQVLAQYG